MNKVKLNYRLTKVLVVMVLIFAIMIFGALGQASDAVDETVKGITESGKHAEDDVIAGYSIVGQLMGASFGALGVMLLALVGFGAWSYATVVFILAFVAKKIFRPTPKRVLTYRILMGFVYFFEAVVAAYIAGAVFNNGFNPLMFVIAFVWVFCIAFSAINTYSSRIMN